MYIVALILMSTQSILDFVLILWKLLEEAGIYSGNGTRHRHDEDKKIKEKRIIII